MLRTLTRQLVPWACSAVSCAPERLCPASSSLVINGTDPSATASSSHAACMQPPDCSMPSSSGRSGTHAATGPISAALAPHGGVASLWGWCQWQSLRGATKKAGGSASQKGAALPKNLGVKMLGGELIFPGQIIVRQRGTKFHPGEGVGMGRDHTLFATRVGMVRFSDAVRPPHAPGKRARAFKRVSVEATRQATAGMRKGQLREAEELLVRRRAEVKRDLARGRGRGFVGFEPALYFPLGTTVGRGGLQVRHRGPAGPPPLAG